MNADEVAGETGETDRENLAYWDGFLFGGPLGEEGARTIIARRERLDRMERLSVQLGWMREAGFQEVTVVYRNHGFAVFSGRRLPEDGDRSRGERGAGGSQGQGF